MCGRKKINLIAGQMKREYFWLTKTGENWYEFIGFDANENSIYHRGEF